jgi:hypothetical protein
LGGRETPELFLTGGPQYPVDQYPIPGLVFNNGDTGGIEGTVNQTLAAGSDLAGLT